MAGENNRAAKPAPPLRIDEVALPSGGVIGLCHCPGRRDGAAAWGRDLGLDLAAIEAWGAAHMLTLVQAREFERLGVPDFAEQAGRARFAWHHVPIRDLHVPETAIAGLWAETERTLVEALERGDRVLVHCAAGLGRSGTVVARLLVDHFGHTADSAIATVRAVRPGTIETLDQEAYVRRPRR